MNRGCSENELYDSISRFCPAVGDDIADLPDDIAALNAALIVSCADAAAAPAQVAEREALIAALNLQIEAYKPAVVMGSALSKSRVSRLREDQLSAATVPCDPARSGRGNSAIDVV